jgi:hypothetical protein
MIESLRGKLSQTQPRIFQVHAVIGFFLLLPNYRFLLPFISFFVSVSVADPGRV